MASSSAAAPASATSRAGVNLEDIAHGKDGSDKVYIGAGVGYDFSDVFGISLNYDLYEADVFDDISVDAETLSLGAEVRF